MSGLYRIRKFGTRRSRRRPLARPRMIRRVEDRKTIRDEGPARRAGMMPMAMSCVEWANPWWTRVTAERNNHDGARVGAFGGDVREIKFERRGFRGIGPRWMTCLMTRAWSSTAAR